MNRVKKQQEESKKEGKLISGLSPQQFIILFKYFYAEAKERLKLEEKINFKQWVDVKNAKIRAEKAKEQKIKARKEKLEKEKRYKRKKEEEILCYAVNKLVKKSK